MKLYRKTFLKYFGSASIITATGGLGALLAACGETSSTIPAVGTSSTAASVLDNFNIPLQMPGNQGVLGVLDASNLPFEVITPQASLEILKGKKTTLDVYQVNQNGKSYTNPIIRVKKGDTFSIRTFA